MRLGHLHIGVQDLPSAIGWMNQILNQKPSFQNPKMASFDLDNISLIFDQSDKNAEMILALKALDCSQLLDDLRERGAVVMEEPQDQPWGVRTAYIQGPGNLTIELEQALK
jgi:uncharacterized glyoxalase superfamily protein PhnB